MLRVLGFVGLVVLAAANIGLGFMAAFELSWLALPFLGGGVVCCKGAVDCLFED